MTAVLPPPLASRLGPIPSSYVAPEVRGLVEPVVRLALAERGFARALVDVKWFSGAPYSLAFVYAPEPTTIWLSSALEGCDALQVVEVVAHEVAHVTDHLAGRASDEAGATRFGEAVAGRFGSSQFEPEGSGAARPIIRRRSNAP